MLSQHLTEAISSQTELITQTGFTQAKFVIATGTKCREAIPESQAITSLRS
ncbi:hypothetical protein FDUTEX481_05906 [Tolypothrix sp. PCC 7601]|nr:hypothetical protein FDUTEX481_05906 [Tolypothrix sp. PCC 7601]